MPGIPFDTVIFDLDGTLIDSAPDVGAAVSRVLADEGLAPLDDELARSLMGEGGKTMVSKAFYLRGRSLDEAELTALTRRFVAHYRDAPIARTVVYPGVAETLAALHDSGVRMAVCTNKFEQPARDILERLDLLARFADVAGADTFAVRKPDPGHVAQLLARVGGDAGTAAMVGDSIHDVQAGQGAGLPVVAVTWGYTVTPPASFGADALIDRFADLPRALAALQPAGRLS